MLFCTEQVSGQTTDTLGTSKTLASCVQYALAHQTNIRQSLIDQQIADKTIKSKLADWYPQVNLNANYQNTFQLQSTVFDSVVRKLGTYNTSLAAINATQTLFNRDVLLAKTSARDVRTYAKQTTTYTTIEVVTNVSKSFYDVLLSKEQINLLDSDLVLLNRSLQDATNQYKGGLVDKTDYQRATIALNNAMAQRKGAVEDVKGKTALLKLVMSYPADSSLDLVYDSAQMQSEVDKLDTNQAVDFNNRIEYQQLLTQKRLQEANLRYYKQGYLPTLSANASYSWNYLNDKFSNLYDTKYPYSYAGVTLGFPIFQGTKRTQQIRIAQLQVQRLDLTFNSTKDSINAQYTQAIASYKSNLMNYREQKENLQLAREVYDIIRLQYRQGIKTYLDVVTANNDLFTSQINYITALYQVLSNKIDVEKALGVLKY